jgi:N-acetylglucosamine-6-sulfatase
MGAMRGVLVVMVGAALVAVLGGSAPERVSAAPAAAKRPNIVLIDTDDQTQASVRFMPNVQRLLAAQGATFDNSFVSYSLCCPSRATVLTGQYAHNHGVLGNSPPNGGYHRLDHTNTLALWLQRAGYRTILIGKYLNGYGKPNPTEVPPGWSEWFGLTKLTFLASQINENGRLVTTPNDESGYQTDVLSRLAQESIRRNARTGKPFFMWLTPHVPHNGGPADPDDPKGGVGTTRPPARYRDRFAGEPLPMPPSFNEADVSDKPAAVRNLPPLTPQRIAAIKEAYQQQLEADLGVDDMVKAVVDTLRATGKLSNTLIVFTSDNGFFHGEHRVPQGKVRLYEPSIRVPLIVRGPGVPRNVHRKQIVANIDLAPTVVALAKAKPRRTMDGRSLVPLFRSASVGASRNLLLEDPTGAAGNPRLYVGVRTNRYVYAEYANGDRELYDLAKDPDELQSQHANPAYDVIKTALAARLHALVSCAGARCHVPPAVRMRTARHGCSVTATVTGAEIHSVGFSVNHRGLRSDTRAPFRVTVRVRGSALLRARVASGVDRLVSVDRTVRGC